MDGRVGLQRLVSWPVSTWNYQAQGAGIRHLGPTAQDFHAAFGLGEDDTTISTVDEQGVALAAVQGLYATVQDKDARIATKVGIGPSMTNPEGLAPERIVAALDESLARLESG